jgi:GMP synthase-like glutamine amidotransferase
MRVVVIANSGDGDAGWVGEYLTECYDAQLVRCWREEPHAWPDLAGVDLVVSLGSDWSVYWDHVQSSVRAEVAFLADAHQQDRPVLGICFGAQIAAHALGGRVERAPVPEVGWYHLELLAPTPFDAGPWFQWHADRIEPPAPARVLARTPHAVQAFTMGRCLAVQFHPEVTQAMVQRWASGSGVAELQRLGVDRITLLEATQQWANARREAAGALVRAVVEGW